MNKFTSIILAFILMFFGFGVIATASVSAADEAVTPDDAFEGNYTEFKGNDGSVTRVFENGSVSTKNKDGSTTAVDYKGNQYSEDKDGNYSVRLTNGETATEYADGRQSMTDINGKIFTVYPDGHITEEYPHLGLVVDSNVDGETLGIGLIGSDERIKADEYGFYENGEIKGKDGSSLTVTDDGVNWINAEGNKYDFKETGNICTVSANYKDGSYCESTLISSGDNGNRTEYTDYLFVTADGTRWDGNKNITYDADGNPVYSNNDVMQVTGTDGSTLWIDNNSKASEYSGADGNRIVTDKNGNLTEYKDGENDWNVTYDENGNVVSSYMTFPDGTRIEKHPDGSEIFVTPDGTKYEADGKGNVFKDGEQIKKDGKWLPGNEPNNGTENSSPGTEPNATPMPTETPTVTEEAKNPAGPDDDGSEDTEKSNDIATPTVTPAPSYAWHRSSTKVEQHEDSKSVAWLEKYTASEGYHTFHDEYIEDDKYDFEGDYIATCSEPPAIIYPNQAFTLNITLESSGNHGNASAWCRTGIPTGSDGGYRTEPKYETADGDSTFTVKCKEGEAHSYDVTVYGKIAEGSKEGELVYVIFTGCGSDTIWIYEWRK